jgi:hypothetical protein
MDGQAERLLAALAGFLIVRFGATWPFRTGRTKHAKEPTAAATPGAGDASDPR